MKDNWLKQNSTNKDYVRLNAGLMKVSEIDEFLNSTSVLSFVDNEKRLRYYKQPLNLHYSPDEIGQKLGSYLKDPDQAKKQEQIFDQLQAGKKVIYQNNPGNTKQHFVVDSYRRIENENKEFAGMALESQNIYPLIEFYLKETGQKLVADPESLVDLPDTDTDTGASEEWTQKGRLRPFFVEVNLLRLNYD